MTRGRKALAAAAAAGALAVAMAAGGVLLLKSEWFHERVRERMVREVERATGGRSEVGSFRFDWKALRAEVREFVLHGTEPADKPPLFRARSIAVGLKVVSLLRKDVDIQWIRVEEPRIHLIVYPDGKTNVPAPKVQRAGRPVMETILKLAVGRFQVEDGIFGIENHGKTPFQASGSNLRAQLGYEAAEPCYQGEISIEPLDLEWGGRKPVPVNVKLGTEIRAGRITVAGRAAREKSEVTFTGAVEDVARFQAAFDYKARLDLAELREIAEVKQPPAGQARAAGQARFDGFTRYGVTGEWSAGGVRWKQGPADLRDFYAEGRLKLVPGRVEATGVRLRGNAWMGRKPAAQPVDGRIESVTYAGRNWTAEGIALKALGGGFAGRAELRDWHAYRVTGEMEGLEASRLLALASDRPAPWDGRVSGPVRVEGSFRKNGSLEAEVRTEVAPAESGARVRGQVAARYSAESGTIDLGHSWLELPATRVEFAGVLGKELAVRAESRDLDDVLPALDVKAPVRLASGAASFRGKVSGPLEDPRIAGRARATGLVVAGRRFDAAEAEVTLAQSRVEVREAAAQRGSLRAQFEGAAALDGWKAGDELLVYGVGTVKDAAAEDLLALAGAETAAATGTVEASVKITGRWGAPLAKVEAAVVKGSLYGEPFDRLTATLDHRPEATEIVAARIDAGTKRIEAKALYSHAGGDFRTGLLRFSAVSNGMPLEEIRRVREVRPDLDGRVQFEAAGEAEVAREAVRLVALKGHVVADGLAMNGRKLGDVRLTADTKGDVLSARLASDFAGSSVRGEGEWRLAADYPGKARVVFSQLDFLRLRDLLAASAAPASVQVAGSMAGEVVAEGPLVRSGAWKAAANIQEMQMGPAPGTELAKTRRDLTLRNSGAVTATMANGVVRVEQARFVGNATDLTVGGTVNVTQKNTLDLKVKGQFELAMLQDVDRDIESSGTVMVDASVRGALRDPHVNGRMELKNAAFSLATFPQGIYNTNGVVAFNGTRATIQELTGESGGGKVRVVGFANYESGSVMFRLFLRAQQVRVRYPEGVSTVANATLNWTGTTERSTLAGTVTIVRAGFNPESDFSSILARQAEPLRTPTSRSGILGGTNFDVQIETSPDITFESSLAQDLQAEANLRLRGTGANPAMLGRVTITQGRLVFFGTRFNINQGSVAFYNPARMEPILNVDLETRARGVDVTLTVSGPINKLNLTPRSDPPLQFNEIVALLATGRAPTSDPSLLAQQSTSPQSWQQVGASALLGQAIATPVAGRLQRFFGVTRLKIDPSLSGVENNPQARLTLEQQVTPNITFTYITNVTNSNPLVVQVEWAVNRMWSVLAVREENGLFGLDFLYKKRF